MSLPTTQKALYVESKQGKWVVADAEVWTPGEGEILVKIESTALNPVDWKIQSTGYFVNDYPAILGSDSAGVVAAVGQGVTNFAVGDRVLHQGFFVNRLATFQQYTIIYSDIAAKIPPSISFDQAASIPLGLATAAVGLFAPKRTGGGGAGFLAPWDEKNAGKHAGQPIVIFGGSSSVGSYTVQLAKLAGFSPIITTSSPSNFDLVKSLGATHPVDRNSTTLVEEVKAIAGRDINIVYDAISLADTQPQAYEIVAEGGQLALVLPLTIPQDKLNAKKEIINVFGSGHVPENREFIAGLYKKLPQLLESGDIKPNVIQYAAGGLASIPDQLELLKNNQISGAKVVVRPPETA